ncbi:MAG: phosphotransferase, partial [bacterium]|nr:phosphotransferase [bacterium]
MAVIDLESLLKQYGLEAVGPIEKLSADSVNETFHVSTNEGEFTVRLYQPGRERNEILYDHSVLRYLAERNFPVPSIVQSKQGETVVSFNQSFAAAFNYLPGKTLARAEIHENNVQSVGETLAWFHGILDDFESEFSKPSHDVEGVRKLLQQHTQELLAMQYPDVGALVEELGQAL